MLKRLKIEITKKTQYFLENSDIIFSETDIYPNMEFQAHFGSIAKFSLKIDLMPEKYKYCGFNWMVSKITSVKAAKTYQL